MCLVHNANNIKIHHKNQTKWNTHVKKSVVLLVFVCATCLLILQINIYSVRIVKVTRMVKPKMLIYFPRMKISPRELLKYFVGCLSLYWFFLTFPFMYATHYPFIEQSEMWNELVKATTVNITSTDEPCQYSIVLNDTFSMTEFVHKEIEWNGSDIKVGGEYVPPFCRPQFSVAIIVPYRQRAEHLQKFLLYMHTYLRKQRTHYRIYVVEQDNMNPFNRATLMNVGSVYAKNAGFPCLILHDVDLLPLKVNNIYACTKMPRHMSSSIAVFRFNLPYEELFGGAVSIQTRQFSTINGMSNVYNGWGGEDDDFYTRIRASGMGICRFDPKVSMYEMLMHASETPNPSRKSLLSSAETRYRKDGLNSLTFKERSIKLHPLFTHIMVDF